MAVKRKRDVHIFFSDEEMESLEKKMQGFGVHNRSAFIRKMALDGFCIRLDLPELREMTTLLRRCGNNLNQYAKVANTTGDVFKEDIIDLRVRLQEIRNVADKLLDSLMQLPGIRV